MSEAIDILAVAASLREAAWRRVEAAKTMQASPDSAIAYEYAQLSWVIANEDLTQVKLLAMEMRA